MDYSKHIHITASLYCLLRRLNKTFLVSIIDISSYAQFYVSNDVYNIDFKGKFQILLSIHIKNRPFDNWKLYDVFKTDRQS